MTLGRSLVQTPEIESLLDKYGSIAPGQLVLREPRLVYLTATQLESCGTDQETFEEFSSACSDANGTIAASMTFHKRLAVKSIGIHRASFKRRREYFIKLKMGDNFIHPQGDEEIRPSGVVEELRAEKWLAHCVTGELFRSKGKQLEIILGKIICKNTLADSRLQSVTSEELGLDEITLDPVAVIR